MRTIKMLTAVLATALLLFAGCSGGDSDDGGTTTDPPADSGDDDDAGGDVSNGRDLYVASCQGCHGPDAEGIEGVGKPLVDSDFVSSTPSAELAEFVKVGRPSSDPDNTTGVDMPPKGGNPSLSDDDLLAIIAFQRTWSPR